MTDKIENALVNVIQDAATTAKTATEFVLAELPEVAQQLLMWHATSSILKSILGVAVLIGLVLFWRWFWEGRGEETGKGAYGCSTLYRPTKTHTDYGRVTDSFILATITTIILSGLALAATLNFTWLKILIAPKLYLLEYAADLVK
jgi:hypothetical protein